MGTDSTDGFVHVADEADLREDGSALVTPAGTAIALFHHEGEVRAVDNACPHMGFPLIDGSVDDGVLTCHWHHARFELSGGDTFDPWADDVLTYPVEVRDGQVFVDPDPDPDRPPRERWRRRLRTGMEENLRLVVAKAVIGLDDAGVAPADPLERGLAFGSQYRADGWSSGQTILAAMGNVIGAGEGGTGAGDDGTEVDDADPAVRGEDARRALYTGLRHVASDCAGEPPQFAQPALDADVRGERLVDWFRECVEVRDRDGAERCLRTAVEGDHTRTTVERMLFAAATDHVYLDAGHTLDFCNKAIEALDRTDWADAADVLGGLVPRLTDAARSEERSQWRQPIDLADLLFEAYEDLDDLAAAGAGVREQRADGWRWTPDDEFRETVLGDDPEAIVDALTGAIEAGATPSALAAPVVDAAAERVARFGTANEFADWNTVHHTFTYANAVREAALRTEPTELYRGVCDAALNVYLDRFLNSPPAPEPDPDGAGGAGDTGSTSDPEALREAVFDAMDREGQVNRAGEVAAEWLASTDDPTPIWAALGETLLREDANFHTLQNYETGWRQFRRAERAEKRRRALVAVARYQAAHFPTRREAEQTFGIAARLHRGETIHAGASGASAGSR